MPAEETSVDLYAAEERLLSYNIADYYLFSKVTYQLPLVYRTLAWEVVAVFSGIACYYIPFGIY